MSSVSNKGPLAKALYNYISQNDDELNLRCGDIIKVLKTELPDEGWWLGEVDGKVGVFPDNFVQLISDPDEQIFFTSCEPPWKQKISAQVMSKNQQNLDTIQSDSAKLIHITANRVKGPQRRPPSKLKNKKNGFGSVDENNREDDDDNDDNNVGGGGSRSSIGGASAFGNRVSGIGRGNNKYDELGRKKSKQASSDAVDNFYDNDDSNETYNPMIDKSQHNKPHHPHQHQHQQQVMLTKQQQQQQQNIHKQQQQHKPQQILIRESKQRSKNSRYDEQIAVNSIPSELDSCWGKSQEYELDNYSSVNSSPQPQPSTASSSGGNVVKSESRATRNAGSSDMDDGGGNDVAGSGGISDDGDDQFMYRVVGKPGISGGRGLKKNNSQDLNHDSEDGGGGGVHDRFKNQPDIDSENERYSGVANRHNQHSQQQLSQQQLKQKSVNDKKILCSQTKIQEQIAPKQYSNNKLENNDNVSNQEGKHFQLPSSRRKKLEDFDNHQSDCRNVNLSLEEYEAMVNEVEMLKNDLREQLQTNERMVQTLRNFLNDERKQVQKLSSELDSLKKLVTKHITFL